MKEGCPVVCEEEGEGHRGCDLIEQAKGVSLLLLVPLTNFPDQ